MEVATNLGACPATWDRPAVFFANLTSLFFGNIAATRALCEMLEGTLNSYGGRLAPVLDLLFREGEVGQNLLVVESAPDGRLLEYHGGVLGLRMPEIVVAEGDRYEDPDLVARVAEHPGGAIDGYVTDAGLVRVAELAGKRTLSTLEGSMLANNKLALHRELLRLGLPTFDTEIAAGPAEVGVCCARLAARGYRSAAVKAQVGASGIGILKVDTWRPDRVSDLMFHDGPCLIQGWVERGINAVRHVHSPSVQVFVGPAVAELYDITDQILDADSVHEGNIAPPHDGGGAGAEDAELLRQAEIIAGWLHGTGYRGPASVDFHVATRGGVREVRACEINARITGATYPSLLARHFQRRGAWLMRNLALSASLPTGDLLDRIAGAGLLFEPGDGRGCIPINFNTDGAGRVVKGQFLFLAPGVEGAADLLTELVALPGIDLHYDRD